MMVSVLDERTNGSSGDSDGVGETTAAFLETEDGLRVVGEVSEANVHLLAAAAEPIVARGGVLTLDLAELSYIDAAGLHAVAELADCLAGRGRVLLDSPGPWVRKVLAVAGVERLENLEVVERMRV